MTDNLQLVLASNSPRRKALLALCGWDFIIVPAEIDETPRPGEGAHAYVLRMAEEKARAAAVKSSPNSLVLAADTTVVDVTPFGETILGKPEDEAQAGEMLRQLRGHSHQVITAIGILRIPDGKLVTDLCITEVPMRSYTDQEIDAYVASGDPMDKAGAYAIQNEEFHPVEHLEGCYSNVVGLPVCHVVRVMRQFGLLDPGPSAAACQSFFGYDCPIYEQVTHETD